MRISRLIDCVMLWRRPFADPAATRRLQNRLLRQVVTHAVSKVPYYRGLFEAAGLRPGDICTVDDLAKIPTSTKDDVATVPVEDRMARGVNPERLVRHVTSGSTGLPSVILRTRWEDAQLLLMQLRAQVVAGLRPTDLRVHIGAPLPKRLPHRLGLFRGECLGHNLGSDEMLRRLRELRPDVLVLHPSLLDILLRTPDREELASVRPRVVFSGAEVLTSTARAACEITFGCSVIDFYGAHEVANIASQCRHCGLYHTNDDGVIVEVLRDGKPVQAGEEGEVAVTALHSYAMPFIRHRLGDIVRRPAAALPCPVRFGTLENIRGRTLDYLDLPNGSLLSPYTVVENLAATPGIVCFQVAQASPTRVVIEFECRAGSEQHTTEAAAEACRRIFPSEMTVEVRRVSSLPLTPAGKRRYIRTNRRTL